MLSVKTPSLKSLERLDVSTQYLFVSSHDSRLSSIHLSNALFIAERAFNTQASSFQIDLTDQNIQWTLQNIPFCWTLILADNECVGSAAVLPTPTSTMKQFLSSEISENDLIEQAKVAVDRIRFAESLYLSGVTVLPKFQRQGLGTQALIHAIEATQNSIPSAQHLYYWPHSAEGVALIEKLQKLKSWVVKAADL